MVRRRKENDGKKRDREKNISEPQVVASLVNVEVWNYNVYHLKTGEKLLYFLLAFLAGALTGYLFYGGLGKDSFGNPTVLTYTLDLSISGVLGVLAGSVFLPIRAGQIKEKKQKSLKGQFIDLMDSLSTSLMAGKNINQAFQNARNDLSIQYSEEADIIRELDVILSGLVNSISVEELLLDFGKRSGVEDIESFGNVFDTCYRKGGNIKDVIQNTAMILVEKASIEQEIDTKLAANKNEQRIMSVMPIVLIALIKGTNPEFARNFTTLPGVMASTFAVGCFVAASYVGKKIMDIKV